MKKELKYQPIEYKFEISEGKYFIVQLPMPIEKFNKREKTRLIKWMKDCISITANKAKLEANAKYQSLLSQAEKLKEDFGLDTIQSSSGGEQE